MKVHICNGKDEADAKRYIEERGPIFEEFINLSMGEPQQVNMLWAVPIEKLKELGYVGDYGERFVLTPEQIETNKQTIRIT